MKLPFDCTIMDDEPVEVRNPFSGYSCMLTPEAVAVYDVVMGANMIGDYKTVQKGVSWFRQHYPREYMILLD
jgi:hypothetical protein